LYDTLEEQPSPIHGMGLFAKRTILQSHTVLLSTPVSPIHRDELTMDNNQQTQQQLLLNYCYGHPLSILLWLPHGPLINSLNHDPNRNPNARIQWHILSETTESTSTTEEEQRLRFHHPELLDALPEDVAKAHGKGLVMDLVSTRPIMLGEEVVIDYGDAWVSAFNTHQSQWSYQKSPLYKSNNIHSMYTSAESYNTRFQNDTIRTVTQQHHQPYPSNIQTACYFEEDWLPDEDFQDDVMTYQSWNDQSDPNFLIPNEDFHDDVMTYKSRNEQKKDTRFDCLLPCLVIEAHATSDTDGDNNGNTLYTAKLVDSAEDNVSIDWDCHIYKKFEYIYTDIPRNAIRFIEKPHKSDVWLPDAFRHAIGVPDDDGTNTNNNVDAMYPDVWKKSNMRRRRVGGTLLDDEGYSSVFKRKNVTPRQDSLDAIQIKMGV